MDVRRAVWKSQLDSVIPGRKDRDFPGKDQEDGLCRIFGQRRVADLAQAGAVDQVRVPPDEIAEGGLRVPLPHTFG